MKTPTIAEKTQLTELVDNLFNHGFKEALCCKYKDGWGRQNMKDYWLSENFEFLNSIDCDLDSGVTRVVVIPENLSWVLKFNFISEVLTVDYNKLEATHFEVAAEEGLDEFFAATYYFTSVDGVDVYIQEKVKVDEDAISDSFYNFTLENLYSGDDENDERIQEMAWTDSNDLTNEERICAMVGDSPKINALLNFIEYNDINDLHSGNWGYRDGEPVMIDYAGY